MNNQYPFDTTSDIPDQLRGSSPPAHGSVPASDVQKILDQTDWEKYWSDVNEASNKEIEAYEQAEARSKRTNRFIR